MSDEGVWCQVTMFGIEFDDERDYEEEEFWRREMEREAEEEWRDMHSMHVQPGIALDFMINNRDIPESK